MQSSTQDGPPPTQWVVPQALDGRRCSRAVAGVFYSGVVKLHLSIQSDPVVSSVLGVFGGHLLSYFDSVVAASVTLAVGHALAVCFVCWQALPRRATRSTAQIGPITRDGGLRQAVESSLAQPSRVKRLRDKFAQWNHKLENHCGVDSYELLVFIEIGLQTFQAYKLSHLVATPWINRLMVLVIVVNCWFMPVVSVVFRKKTPSFVKVVYLALDSIMELAYGMVIPLAIFYPYYRDANHMMYDQPYMGFYMDTWYVNALAENRQTFITSWFDFCSKMAPGISLFIRLYEVQVQRAAHETRTRAASIMKVVVQDPHTSSLRKKKRVINAVMLLFGLGVLVVHLAANAVSFTGRDRGCLLEMMPFGSTQYTCVVLEVSCTQKKITGTKSELDEALSFVDPNSLQVLILSHCEALSMPPRLKTFPKLVEIKIHNTSIAEWSEDAALTAQDHPVLQTFYVTTTNMSEIPKGLLSPDFPPVLSDIEFCETNLTGLPANLLEKWAFVWFFYLELSPGIAEFPSALYNATSAIPFLSLSSNSIATLPEEVFVGHEYMFLLVSGNPLVKLPNEIGSTSSMGSLSIAYTEVTGVPLSWTSATNEAIEAATQSGFALSARGTPLCDKLTGDKPEPFSSDVEMLA